jgi:hypothetical protein
MGYRLKFDTRMNHPHKPDGPADRQQIIDEAKAAVEAFRNLMADAGLTPEACLETLRRTEGGAAVQRVHSKVDVVLRAIEDQARQAAAHAAPARPVSRHIARRRTI